MTRRRRLTLVFAILLALPIWYISSYFACEWASGRGHLPWPIYSKLRTTVFLPLFRYGNEESRGGQLFGTTAAFCRYGHYHSWDECRVMVEGGFDD